MPTSRVLFYAGAIVLLLTAAIHTAAHFGSRPDPKGEDETTLLRLMDTHQMNLAGAKRTMTEIFDGFSLSYSLFLAFAAAVDLVIARLRPADAGLLRALTILNICMAALMLVISLVYFFYIPTVCMSAALLLFVLALVVPRPAAAPRAIQESMA